MPQSRRVALLSHPLEVGVEPLSSWLLCVPFLFWGPLTLFPQLDLVPPGVAQHVQPRRSLLFM